MQFSSSRTFPGQAQASIACLRSVLIVGIRFGLIRVLADQKLSEWADILASLTKGRDLDNDHV
jgi:hypothetical protein